jgi:hypothetical protein
LRFYRPLSVACGRIFTIITLSTLEMARRLLEETEILDGAHEGREDAAATAPAGTQGAADLRLTPESHLPGRPRVRRGRVRYEALHPQRVEFLLAA